MDIKSTTDKDRAGNAGRALKISFVFYAREKRKHVKRFNLALLWFGAAISLAEILTGTLYASLDTKTAVLSILLGHGIGAVLFYLAAYLSARTKLPAMEATAISFGAYGSKFFAGLNVVQLVGWTAIMIASGAQAASALNLGFSYHAFVVLIALLIMAWIVFSRSGIHIINSIAVVLVLIVCVFMSVHVLGEGISSEQSSTLSNFASMVELSIAMPLSWLPLVGDYVYKAERPKKASFIAALSYTIASIWMYLLGFAAAKITSSADLSSLFALSRLGILSIYLVVISTVTTTFLDAYSAGQSGFAISKRISIKASAIGATLVGMILALSVDVSNFEHFLYFIGSVFAPMIALLFTDFYLLKKEYGEKNHYRINMLIWLIGFIMYRQILVLEVPYLIPTLVVFVGLIILKLLSNVLLRRESLMN
ncbi:MAG: putative hydroxymethylpyrimidine transporter CytX [Coriobacteriia bacterium]|nr:putative hydroxymethylpyrimidine transporter CytX [Coriobacteriia bacterium]